MHKQNRDAKHKTESWPQHAVNNGCDADDFQDGVVRGSWFIEAWELCARDAVIARKLLHCFNISGGHPAALVERTL